MSSGCCTPGTTRATTRYCRSGPTSRTYVTCCTCTGATSSGSTPGSSSPRPPAGLEGTPDDTSPLPLGAAAVQAGGPKDRLAFLVQSGGETVGLVLAHRTSPGTAQVDLDYVLPRFRDFTPGEFVFRPDGPFAAAGVGTVVAPQGMQASERYFAAIGFRRRDGDLVLEFR
jgi:hypothetical protein